MKLQEVTFPSQSDENLMFFREKEGELSFDTYFNSFSYTKYRDYTKVQNVTFSCRFHGSATVQICVYDGIENVITQGDFTDDAALEVGFSKLPENGFLYPKFIFKSDFEFLSGEYSSNVQPEKISVCIAICTYKREQFVRKNIELLKSFKFSCINRVFVIDNGKTLDQNAISDDFLKVIPNKNYGGSGGFTRGLIEAYDGGYSHIILMDDDIEFRPETLEQMTAFVSILMNKYEKSWISASMLQLDRKWLQYEMGAEWNEILLPHKRNLDMRSLNNLLDNLDNPNVDYGAWWTLLMPVSVTENGLPLPFFIKADDIEYGLRKSSGTEIITMNAVGVFHEGFDKKKSFILDYYIFRNEMIVNTLYCKYGAFRAAKRLLYDIAKQLVFYRYDNCKTIFKAADDYLKGIDFFLKTDEEALNTQLMAMVPKLVPLSDIPCWSSEPNSEDYHVTKKMLFTLGGHLIPWFALKRDIPTFPLSKPRLCDVYARKAVIQYQLGGDMGILAERSFAKFLKYGFISVVFSVKLLFGFKRAFKSYNQRKNEITSFEFWRKHLEID